MESLSPLQERDRDQVIRFSVFHLTPSYDINPLAPLGVDNLPRGHFSGPVFDPMIIRL